MKSLTSIDTTFNTSKPTWELVLWLIYLWAVHTVANTDTNADTDTNGDADTDVCCSMNAVTTPTPILHINSSFLDIKLYTLFLSILLWRSNDAYI